VKKGSLSNRERKLPAFHDLGIIDIEEVGIQQRLYDASDDGNRLEVAFGKIPIYPIGDIECPVETESK
jgi:hypothetical protein